MQQQEVVSGVGQGYGVRAEISVTILILRSSRKYPNSLKRRD